MFDRAFPHLAGYKDRTTSDLPKEELGFIKSLLQASVHPSYKWRTYGQNESDNITHVRHSSYMEGYAFPKGPLKYMSPEDKEKVHVMAEMRMQELQDTGYVELIQVVER